MQRHRIDTNMSTTENLRIAERLNMNTADVDRLSQAIDYARLGKLVDGDARGVVEFEDCDQVHNDEGY